MHYRRVVLLILNRETEQWPSILTLASSQEFSSLFHPTQPLYAPPETALLL